MTPDILSAAIKAAQEAADAAQDVAQTAQTFAKAHTDNNPDWNPTDSADAAQEEATRALRFAEKASENGPDVVECLRKTVTHTMKAVDYAEEIMSFTDKRGIDGSELRKAIKKATTATNTINQLL